MSKSYIAIREEIEELKTRGYDETTILSVLQAKYQESNIERIYTEAKWEEEKEIEEEEQRIENADKIEKKLDKTGKLIFGLLGTTIIVIMILFLIYFVFPAIDGCFGFVEALSEIE